VPTHWTYASFAHDDDLEQGDIVRPTDELRAIFKAVHPHFEDPKYLAFIVITQTCDLVFRNAECKSRYVNLAVVRPLDSLLFFMVDAVAEKVTNGVYISESKGKARMLLERLFNQNEQRLGLFYLHPDADAGIAVPAVALLQVSIALRSRNHYETIRRARVGRLNREFQSKLGWLIGNLFARVATKDWPKTDMKKLVKTTLDDTSAELSPVWVSRASVAAANEKGIRLKSLSRDEAVRVANEHTPRKALDLALERVARLIGKTLPSATTEDLSKVALRLRNDPEFCRLFRRQ
jgi:hypothetical protein